jgi:CRP/FNR family transcriptional regulator, transcriptional activator FtrB
MQTIDAMTPAMSDSESAVSALDLSLFRDAPIFKEVEEAGLEGLAAISTILTVPEGTTLSQQGSVANQLLVLLEGQIALENAAASGLSAVVEVVQPGSHCMLSSVLSGFPGLMTARTISAAKLIGIDAAGLRALLHRDESVAMALLRAEASEFGAMVRQVCDLKLRTTAQRLGCYLLELTEEGAPNTVSLRLPFDKRLLAARLGCRQENLSRAFAALRRLGVETHGARVTLHDVASLRGYALSDG